MNRPGFVPVHDEPGGITFKYDVATFNFASSLKFVAPSEDIGTVKDADIIRNTENASQLGDDVEDVPDFLGFDEEDMEPEVSLKQRP